MYTVFANIFRTNLTTCLTRVRFCWLYVWSKSKFDQFVSSQCPRFWFYVSFCLCSCVSLCIYSVLWEPMGDGKRVISLADNHALLWDLQESSTQATVRLSQTANQTPCRHTSYSTIANSFFW